MATLVLPLDNLDPAFSFSTVLDTKTYNFSFRWDGRMENWIFDLFDDQQNSIQTGNTLIVGFELMAQNVSADRPPGKFMALNHAEIGANPTRFNIGSDVKLYYVEEADAG